MSAPEFTLLITIALFARGETRAQPFHAVVEPLLGENLAASCVFDLSIPAPQKPVRAVWITYDRGFDISRYYDDSEVVIFAQRHAVALMLAHQCPAKSPPTHEQGEMDMDPSQGVGRSIFAALDDLSRQSRHAEISSAKLIVMGFSGIGALFAQFVRYAPDRVVAAILANPGQSDPYGMNAVDFPATALAVPEFIIVGGRDDRGGTQRPYSYFNRHQPRGAPWVFLVQNGIPHCCVIDAKALILKWLEDMMRLREPAFDKPLRTIDTSKGWSGFIHPCESVTRDHWGEPLWNVCDASIQLARLPSPPDERAAGWFPDRQIALDWLQFIRQKEHPATSFPDGKDAAHSQFAIH